MTNEEIRDRILDLAADLLDLAVELLPTSEPPAEEPPAENEPPAEEPPAEEPPAEEPPTEEPPAEGPPAEPPVNLSFFWAEPPTPVVAAGLVDVVYDTEWGTAKVSNQDSNHDAYTFAGGLFAASTDDPAVIDKVADAIEQAIGTEVGGRTLALARNLTGYVLAADYIGYYNQRFIDWVDRVRTTSLDGRTLVSTQEDRPNNWGTHAGAARIAADLYLGDHEDLDRAATVFRGYLGDRDAYAGFKYGSDLSWQADPSKPVGINPQGATIQGYDVDGVMPDDQRRTGGFQDLAPKGSYPWEAMQGVMTAGILLQRNGYPDVFEWCDEAIIRAYTWLVDVNENPPTGDDRFLGPLWNSIFGASWYGGPVGHGKSIGWTDLTHG